MKAQVLQKSARIETNPLQLTDVPAPMPSAGHILVEVSVCGVCHTDLHIIEGELLDSALPLIPGHQVVGKVVELGEEVTRFQQGARVGIPWLHQSCGHCEYCLQGQENLCESPLFTGYTAQGGYAEFISVPEAFSVPLPDGFSDVDAAPLLCAGIVGYRSIKLSGLEPGERIGLYGFGASAYICLQIARYWNCEVYVFTRSEQHKQRSLEIGAVWTGQAQDEPPRKLDRAIIFAPAGWIVPLALGHLKKAGTLCINAIHMSNIPRNALFTPLA
jgi:alcohol dehydrogenase, propanol-preferring